MKRVTCVLISLLLCCACSAPNAPSGESLNPAFERVSATVVEKMKEYGVPGVAIGILSEGKTAFRGYGVTSVDHPLPVTDDTLFQIGSISKTFTGTAIMRLVESGKLKLDAPVRTYLPEFRVKDEIASKQATVLTMLTHMGGWEGDVFEDTGDGDDALKLVLSRLAEVEQVAPFNSLWSYNNAGFYVAGRLIEVATGATYEKALSDLVLDPLQLKNTFLMPEDVMTRRFAVGHGGPVEKLNVLRPWHLPRSLHAVGGVVADVKDLLSYGKFHMGDGAAENGARLLSSESMEHMKSTQFTKQGTDEEMAITWHISNAGGLRQVSHGGSTTGQQSLLTLVPSHQFAVALLTNSARGSQLNRDVTRAAMREYLSASITDPAPVEVADQEMAQLVGIYTRPYADVNVKQEGKRLLIQTVTKQGFPTRATPVGPPGPPSAYAFYAKDRLIAIEGPQKGARAEILRLPDGSVGWIRVGRIFRKQAATSS